MIKPPGAIARRFPDAKRGRILISRPHPKPIVFTTRRGPNFLWHMLSVAKIGYDSDYADRYRDTIDQIDLDILEGHKHLLWFLAGEGGELAGLFTAFPAWLHIEDYNGFARYSDIVQTAIEAGCLEPFVKAYPRVDWTDKFMAASLERAEFPENRLELLAPAREIGDVYLRSYETYVNRVWPEAQSAMEDRRDRFQDLFSREDYIAKWEGFLGIPFAADSYEIVLCFSNKSGPDYNSLGYSGNLCYYDKPFDRTWQFLSHEIGTHLLIDEYAKLAGTGQYEHKALYAAYETLAMFYNRLILGLDTLAYDLSMFDDSRHLAIYEGAYRDGIPPGELLLTALET